MPSDCGWNRRQRYDDARRDNQGDRNRRSLVRQRHVPGRRLEGRENVLFVVGAGRDSLVNVDGLRRVKRQEREDDEQEVDHQLAATFRAGPCGVHGVYESTSTV